MPTFHIVYKKKEIIEKLAQSTASKVRDRANRDIIAKFYN